MEDDMRRIVSILMVAVLAATSTVLSASERSRPLPMRALLEQWRLRESQITVELTSGSSLTGLVDRLDESQLHLLSDTKSSEDVIPYDEIRALIDRSTGERMEAQIAGPAGKLPRPRTSLRAWLIAGIIAGALIVLVFA